MKGPTITPPTNSPKITGSAKLLKILPNPHTTTIRIKMTLKSSIDHQYIKKLNNSKLPQTTKQGKQKKLIRELNQNYLHKNTEYLESARIEPLLIAPDYGKIKTDLRNQNPSTKNYLYALHPRGVPYAGAYHNPRSQCGRH